MKIQSCRPLVTVCQKWIMISISHHGVTGAAGIYWSGDISGAGERQYSQYMVEA